MATVKISDYAGAVVNGDWSPAVLAAVDAIDAAGGTVLIDTNIELKSTIIIQPSSNYFSLIFQGDGGSQITINAPTNAVVFFLNNLNVAMFRDINFVGETGTGATADCHYLIQSEYVNRFVVDRCQFFGLVATSALIRAGIGNCSIRDSHFGGCGAADAHIWCRDSQGGRISGCEFIDYGNYLTNGYDRQSARTQWILCNTSNESVFWPANNIAFGVFVAALTIEHCRFDEGAETHVKVADYPRVTIRNCSSNIGSTSSARAIDLTNVRRALIEQHVSGHTDQNRPAVIASGCRMVTIDGQMVRNGVNTGTVDGPVSVRQ